jgi:hypothetical protein
MDPNRSPEICVGITHALACPHCRAGFEHTVVGLFWDRDEASWRCLLCGHRTYDRPRRSDAEITTDRLWEQLFPSVDEDGCGRSHEGEEELEEEWAHPQDGAIVRNT